MSITFITYCMQAASDAQQQMQAGLEGPGLLSAPGPAPASTTTTTTTSSAPAAAYHDLTTRHYTCSSAFRCVAEHCCSTPAHAADPSPSGCCPLLTCCCAPVSCRHTSSCWSLPSHDPTVAYYCHAAAHCHPASAHAHHGAAHCCPAAAYDCPCCLVAVLLLVVLHPPLSDRFMIVAYNEVWSARHDHHLDQTAMMTATSLYI